MIKEEQMTLDLSDPVFCCGKTFPEHSHRTAARTSESSSKKSQKSQTKQFLFLDLRGGRDGATPGQSSEKVGAWRGESWTPNFGEFPSVAVESHLSEILTETPHPKYYLTAKGCRGVINRADRRIGKTGNDNFPEALRQALIEQAEYLESHPDALTKAIEWYESHPDALTKKTGTLVAGLSHHSGTVQDSCLCYETYRKTAHPQNAEQAQGYEKTDKADTLNVFDNTEARTPILIKNETTMWNGDDVAPTLTKNNAGGGSECPTKKTSTILSKPTAYDTYNSTVTGDKVSTLGVNCGMSTGRQQLIETGGGYSSDSVIALDRASYNQGKNAQYGIGVDEDGTAFTVTAKGPGLVKE